MSIRKQDRDIRLYWSNEDNCYIATLIHPTDYISAHGDTVEECLKEFGVALELYLQVTEEDDLRNNKN